MTNNSGFCVDVHYAGVMLYVLNSYPLARLDLHFLPNFSTVLALITKCSVSATFCTALYLLSILLEGFSG